MRLMDDSRTRRLKHGSTAKSEELCKKHDGKELKILGANTNFFSAGFLFTDEEGNECLMYITHTNDRKIVLKRKDGSDDGK